jgi:hypothetical protein
MPLSLATSIEIGSGPSCDIRAWVLLTLFIPFRALRTRCSCEGRLKGVYSEHRALASTADGGSSGKQGIVVRAFYEVGSGYEIVSDCGS